MCACHGESAAVNRTRLGFNSHQITQKPLLFPLLINSGPTKGRALYFNLLGWFREFD